jgi:hypothetical protein
MTDLTREQRRALETSIKAAREEAEIAAAEALRGLRVPDAEAPAGFDPERRAQRNRLRAHARALDDKRATNGAQAISRLTEQAAYVQWHRLLFARFLAERGLLRDETGAPVSLTDCREIALDLSADEDEWSVASGFAAGMLPGVFPPDDPVESLKLTRERGRELRNRLLSIDAAVFVADDSLGWTYQFWRAAEKEAVNKSQVKIGAAELPAVTQLFTEPYMVRFLLHNTLGAWWAGRVLAGNPALARDAADEAALRKACALPGYAWEYLRFVQKDGVWRPAAGTFPGWPTTAKALTVLDPCCGSGHFLTEALAALTALRVVEERLSAADGVAAVLRDNLAGLEIDGRCVQIAAFALALAAWRIGGPGVALPAPNVAWVGAPPPLPKAEFVALANGDAELRRGLGALHDLFVQAPLLGSLIEPIGSDLVDPMRVAGIEDSLSKLVEKMRNAEPERAEGVVAARGMADAVAVLSRQHTLLATNVPFLNQSKYTDVLKKHIYGAFEIAKENLATAFLIRMLNIVQYNGTVATVAPQSWWFLKRYTELRKMILLNKTIKVLARLGENAFSSPQAGGEIVGLTILNNDKHQQHSKIINNNDLPISLIDMTASSEYSEKSTLAKNAEVSTQDQQSYLKDSTFAFYFKTISQTGRISDFCSALQGCVTGDSPRFLRKFWEPALIGEDWELLQTTSPITQKFGGMTDAIFFQKEQGQLAALADSVKHLNHSLQNWRKGKPNWRKRGVVVSQMGIFPSSIYMGNIYDHNCCAIVPFDENDLDPLWRFVQSSDFLDSVKVLNQNRKVEVGTLLNVSIDLDRWRHPVSESREVGFPEPYSDDPTQWIFHGHPRHASAGTEIHVALARLAGYRWPGEADTAMRLSTEARVRIAEAVTLPAADSDGLLPLTPLLGERALADRLRTFCIAAWGADWQPGTEAALVAAACDFAKDKRPAALTLDAWLRTYAARQHAKLFHDRPFLWWITDGRVDGFCAIAHYHRLTKDKLERLAFQMLGDHLTRLGEDPRAEAARILQRKLERIIEGEIPFDIFVRWKPLHAQPLGWEPDLDDGVRLNLRPFIEAGVLAYIPNVKYTVDRGKDIDSVAWHDAFGGERRNDHHTTLDEKRDARAKAKP